jgi:hypothetical protein
MIPAALLCTGLIVALGCGSKPTPTQPSAPENPSPTAASPQSPTPDPNAGTPKVESPKVVHELDQAKQVIPASPVRGSIGGAEVTPEVVIEGDELTFRTLKAGTPVIDRCVKVKLAPMHLPGQPLPAVLGREWKVKLDGDAGPNTPELWLEVGGKPPHLYPSGYAMTLEVGPRKDGKVPGKIYLSLPDDNKTVLAGTFAADYVRPHTEKPGPDDGPYITGEVTVTGAKLEDQVRVAYAEFPAGGVVFVKELQIPFDPMPLEAARWTREETDKPRTSTLVSGDGKARPFRYEHVKLPPGRYLLSAAVVGGPAVWKWVDLPAGVTLTENFTLDATKIGGVEVSVPATVKDKVLIAPASEPGKPVLDGDLFRVIAFQVVRQDVEIAGGKAVVKNLGPGKYEVRVGELRGNVEVVAGKTAELVLTPPKQP